MKNEAPIFQFDFKYRSTNNQLLCGIDEAGRGPLAGPVVAAALILPKDILINGLNDSKKISAKMRDRLDIEIREKAVSFGIGTAEAAEIDSVNILQATFIAMQRAIDALQIPPDYLLVDGRDFPGFIFNGTAIPGEAVVKGDGKSAVMAGASILAKVYRDRLMVRYSSEIPGYGFEQHKGYGTQMHREKIVELGPCPLHRKKFLRKIFHSER